MDEYYPEKYSKDFEHRCSKFRDKLDDSIEDAMETPDNYLRIWQLNPSYKDIKKDFLNIYAF